MTIASRHDADGNCPTCHRQMVFAIDASVSEGQPSALRASAPEGMTAMSPERSALWTIADRANHLRRYGGHGHVCEYRQQNDAVCDIAAKGLADGLNDAVARAKAAQSDGCAPSSPEEYAEAAVRHGDRELTIERSDGLLRFSAIGFDEAGNLDHQCGPLDTSPAALVRTIEWLLAARPTQAQARTPSAAGAASAPEGIDTRPGRVIHLPPKPKPEPIEALLDVAASARSVERAWRLAYAPPAMVERMNLLRERLDRLDGRTPPADSAIAEGPAG